MKCKIPLYLAMIAFSSLAYSGVVEEFDDETFDEQQSQEVVENRDDLTDEEMLDPIIADSYQSRRNAARSKRMVLVKRKNQAPVADFYDDELVSDSDSPDSITQQPQKTQEKAYRQHYSLYGDFLYWQPVVNNTYWAYKAQSATADKEYRFHFDWDMGFRVGAAFKTTWENLTIDANWTRFHTSSTNTHQDTSIFGSPSGTFPRYSLYGLPYGLYSYGSPWKVQSIYKVHFDQIDLTFKRAISISNNFTLSPFGGVRALKMRYSLDSTRYSTNYGLPLSTPNGPLDRSSIYLKDKMESIGLLGGINANLLFGYGFGFYFAGDFFMGYGSEKTTNSSQDVFAGTITGQESISQNTNTLRTMFDISSGFSWNRNFCKNRLNVLFSAGYEFHVALLHNSCQEG